jgi:hypothetical protein
MVASRRWRVCVCWESHTVRVCRSIMPALLGPRSANENHAQTKTTRTRKPSHSNPPLSFTPTLRLHTARALRVRCCTWQPSPAHFSLRSHPQSSSSSQQYPTPTPSCKELAQGREREKELQQYQTTPATEGARPRGAARLPT